MNSITNNKYEHLLNSQFGSTVMYFYTFDTTQKNNQIINDFIIKFDGVFKLIFEVIYSNKTLKLDYDIESNKVLIKKPEYIVSKLFVLKRSETKTNMIYYEINNFMTKHLKSNPNTTRITADIIASVKQYDEYDSNVNMLLLSGVVPRILRLNNIDFNIDKTNIDKTNIDKTNSDSSMIFITFETEIKSDTALFNRLKIIGNSLFVVPTPELIRSKIVELSDSIYGDLDETKGLFINRTILTLTELMSKPEELNKLTMEYKLQAIFFN
jgi:hypothetical protein